MLDGPRPSLFALGAARPAPTMDTYTNVMRTRWMSAFVVGGSSGVYHTGIPPTPVAWMRLGRSSGSFAPPVGATRPICGAVIEESVGALIGGRFKQREQTDSLAPGH